MDYLKAFLVGGAICMLGQILIDKTRLTPARILVCYVVLGVILGGAGVYDKLVDFAGAGATVPLTGFGNTLAKGVRIKVTHLRDLFRPDARNFPRHHEVGFGDVRRIFAFYPAQICAVQISGVIIEKSRRSCCLSRSPRLLTSFHIEEFHGAGRVLFMPCLSSFLR